MLKKSRNFLNILGETDGRSLIDYISSKTFHDKDISNILNNPILIGGKIQEDFILPQRWNQTNMKEI